MSALHAVRDGAAVAVELVALIFSAPQMAGAHEARTVPPRAVVTQSPRTASDAARELHALHVALEGRRLGALTDLRVVELSRGGDPIEAGADGGCGDDDDAAHDGHVQATLDETIADLTRPSSVQRLDPASPLPVASQFALLDHPDGAMLVVIPPREAVGQAVLTLRPGRGETVRITLGNVDARPVVYVVPLDIAPDDLLGGSVELEIADRDRITWATLTAAQATEPTAAVVAHGAPR